MKFLGFGLLGSGVVLMVAAYRNVSPLSVVSNRAKGKGGTASPTSLGTMVNAPVTVSTPGGKTRVTAQ